MRNFNVHRSSMSRYMGRTSSYRRSSSNSRNSYKLGANTFKSYLQEAQKISDEIKGNETQEENSSASKSSVLSKYGRTKAATYKTSTSRFNTGYDAIADSTDTFETLFKKDEFDKEKGLAAAEKFVDGYNELVASVKSSSNSSVSSKAAYFTDIAGLYTRTLENAGITADKNGELSINKEKFDAADIKDLKSLFSKKSSFASYITEQADNIKLVSTLSTDTYSSNTNTFGSSYANGFTSAMSGSLFNWKL